MYCQSCGHQIYQQEVCPSCGTRQQNFRGGATGKPDDPNILFNLLACCFPLVGLILFLVWKDEKPRTAKAVGMWALIGFGAGIALYVVGFVLGVLAELM